MGKMDLWKDEKDSIANKTLQSLGAILTSYQSLQVDEAALGTIHKLRLQFLQIFDHPPT